MTVLRGAGPTGPTGATGEAGEAGEAGGGYDTRWLDLRVAADDRARSADLLRRLLGDVATMDRSGLHLLDLGCGAGAMQRWCAERLPGPARWTLLDPDPELLAVATSRAAPGTATVARVGTVADLDADLLADVDAVVCSALLDVLTPDDLHRLVDVLTATRVPLLASITVTGEVRLSPEHPDDARAARAVHATATADGAAGPAGLDLLRTAAGRHGATVVERRTPWLLEPGADDALVRAWGDGYVAAAQAHDDHLDRWGRARTELLGRAGLTVAVEHVDVLLLPP
ncbi:methyltransferase domain-containing protein [Aquipuribacter sp. MA13-6]|uniref:methyltransferase domain-containing protein n=1 Tax=unclassified Aquipuribacter TaxID=2635084 RepID=UPI003EEC4726